MEEDAVLKRALNCSQNIPQKKQKIFLDKEGLVKYTFMQTLA